MGQYIGRDNKFLLNDPWHKYKFSHFQHRNRNEARLQTDIQIFAVNFYFSSLHFHLCCCGFPLSLFRIWPTEKFARNAHQTGIKSRKCFNYLFVITLLHFELKLKVEGFAFCPASLCRPTFTFAFWSTASDLRMQVNLISWAKEGPQIHTRTACKTHSLTKSSRKGAKQSKQNAKCNI